MKHCRNRTFALETRPRGIPAFTILELLIVIVIIAVLTCLLTTSAMKTRQASSTLICKSNLRQIGLGLQMYSNDFRDRYPDAYTAGGAYFRRGMGEKNPTDKFSQSERYGLHAVLSDGGYLPFLPAAWMCPGAPDDIRDFKNTYVWGLLWDKDGQSTSLDRGREKFKSVFFVWECTINLPYYPGFRRAKKDANPLDSNPIKRVSFYHAYQSNRPGKVALNGDTYRGAMNVLFLDGSIGMADYTSDTTGALSMTVSRE